MKLNNETKIGILVLAVIVTLAVITWKAGDFSLQKGGYEVKVHLKNIDGVSTNAPVTVNGFEVGRVTDIKILYGKTTNVELLVWLSDEAKLREGATASVKNLGFMGEKFIALTTGEDGKPFLKPGAILHGVEPGSFEQILSDGEVIAKNLKEISVNVNERLRVNSEAIDEIIADLRVSMKNIRSISDNVDERLAKNKELIDESVQNMNTMTVNLEEMSYDLKINPWKLMYKPKELKGKY